MTKAKSASANQELFDQRESDSKSKSEVPKPNGAANPWSTRAERQEFFLPVTGFVWLYPEEVTVVNHPAFQRLGRVYQLGQTYFVYRGATHRRIEHVLGAVHTVQRMIDAVKHNIEKAKARDEAYAAELTESEQRFIRLGALLHDIGHVAAGHTLEDELGLISKHDGDDRLDQIFDATRWTNNERQTLGQVIDTEFAKYIPVSLQKKSVRASEIARVMIRKAPENKADDNYQSVQKKLDESAEIRANVCCKMIGDTICADLLDYLHRDWYHVGKPRPFDERILQYMEIRTDVGSFAESGPTPKASDTFVISLGRRPKIRTDAVSAILELLEWRYQLAESVLFHRTKLAAAGMLDRALFELWGDQPTTEIEDIILPLGDDQLISESKKLAEASKKERAKVAASLLDQLERRQLYTGLLTYTHDDLPPDVRTAIQNQYASPAARNRVLNLLENDFELTPGSLAMYCPKPGMNVKIAEVCIAVGDEVKTFTDYENAHENQLSGGHLEAQIHRFRRLWRVHFFIDREVKEDLKPEILHALRQAIEKLALGNIHEEESESAVKALAYALTSIPSSPWCDREIRENSVVGAYQDETLGLGKYPFGAPSLRSFLD